MTELSHTVREEPDAVRVHLTGTLDLYTTSEFGSVLLDLVPENRDLVLDLSGLEFTDSSGLSLLVATHKRCLARGGKLLLDQVPSHLGRVLTVTGLNEVFGILGSSSDVH